MSDDRRKRWFSWVPANRYPELKGLDVEMQLRVLNRAWVKVSRESPWWTRFGPFAMALFAIAQTTIMLSVPPGWQYKRVFGTCA